MRSAKAALVIRVLDDYTGRNIRDFLKLYIPGERLPIGKSGGFYVFSDLKGRYLQLHVSHPHYQEMVRPVVLEEGSGVTEITLRLMPKRGYPGFDKITVIQGAAEIGSHVELRCLTPGKPFKLWRDYLAKCGEEIFIYHPESNPLIGRKFLIKDKERGEEEFFRIWKMDYGAKGKYLLKEALKKTYAKEETSLWPIYETYADSRGCFSFCLGEELAGDGRCQVAVGNIKGAGVICGVEPGRMNRISMGGGS